MGKPRVFPLTLILSQELSARLKMGPTARFAVSPGAGYIRVAASGSAEKTRICHETVSEAGSHPDFELKDGMRSFCPYPGDRLTALFLRGGENGAEPQRAEGKGEFQGGSIQGSEAWALAWPE